MRLFCIAGLLAALVVTGCGGGGTAAGPDTLQVGNGAEVQDLDPHLVSGVTEHRVLSALFEGLADVDPTTLEAVPGAAASWEVSPDKLTYTFHLRADGRWSNGEPVTAYDFAYAWRRMLSPKLGAEYAYMLHCLKNARAYNLGELADFRQVGVRVVDELTLEARLEHPTPYFLRMQTHFAWFPVHRATIEAHGAMDERGTAWTRAGSHAGNGAFTLVKWVPNEVIRVEKNPHYWNADAVRLPAIAFYPIDNLQTEERKFRSGALDLTADVPLHRIDVYRTERPEVFNLHPYCGVYFYRFNVTRPPFDDARVRRAFAMAIDRDQLAKHVLHDSVLPAGAYVPPDTAGYNASTEVPYDPEAARALLAEAGFPDGAGLPAIEILYNTAESHRTIAEAVQRMWKEHLNAQVTLLNQDWKVYLSSMNNLDYAVARSAWIADVEDPVNFLECFLTGGGNNRTGWSSPEFDQLVRAAYQERDNAARYAKLEEAEALLLQEAPIAPIYFYTWRFLKSPRVGGLVPNRLGYIRWTDLYLKPDEAGAAP